MNRTKWTLCSVCLLGLVAYTSIAWAQVRLQNEAQRSEVGQTEIRAGSSAVPRDGYGGAHAAGQAFRPQANMGLTRQRTISRTVNEVVLEPVPPEELEEFQAFQQAKQTLKDAKDETEKKTAIETIQRHLDKQFERDLAQRERDLSAIEERVKSLRQQLSKRQVAKNEIISLRLKTIVNSAEGLDFPGDDDLQDRPINSNVPPFVPGTRAGTPGGYSRGPGANPGGSNGAPSVPQAK